MSVYAVVLPSGGRSTIQTGRCGSARSVRSLGDENASTVTAMSGTVLRPVLRTSITRRVGSATCWRTGNDERTIATR